MGILPSPCLVSVAVKTKSRVLPGGDHKMSMHLIQHTAMEHIITTRSMHEAAQKVFLDHKDGGVANRALDRLDLDNCSGCSAVARCRVCGGGILSHQLLGLLCQATAHCIFIHFILNWDSKFKPIPLVSAREKMWFGPLGLIAALSYPPKPKRVQLLASFSSQLQIPAGLASLTSQDVCKEGGLETQILRECPNCYQTKRETLPESARGAGTVCYYSYLCAKSLLTTITKRACKKFMIETACRWPGPLTPQWFT